MKQNATSSGVLITQQLLSLLPLCHRAFQEESGEFWQGNIVPVKIHPLEELKRNSVFRDDSETGVKREGTPAKRAKY